MRWINKKMKKGILFFCVFLCLSSSFCWGNTFNKANAAYNEKNYEQAINLYLQCINEGYNDVFVYYNLGNAYFKNDQIGKAILYYEKAHRMAPNNEDITHNLAFANSKTIDKVENETFFLTRWGNALVYLFSVQQWAILSIIFAVLFCLSVALFIIVRQSQWRVGLFFSNIVFVILLALSIVLGIVGKHKQNNSNEVIVTQLNVTVKSMPDESGTDLFSVHEGIKASITDVADKWIEVKFPNGEKGWILAECAEKI